MLLLREHSTNVDLSATKRAHVAHKFICFLTKILERIQHFSYSRDNGIKWYVFAYYAMSLLIYYGARV